MIQPTVFLFDADWDGLPGYYGGVFDPAFLDAFKKSDPQGASRTAVLRGDTMQLQLVQSVSSVSANTHGKYQSMGHSVSYNRDALLTIAHDLAVGLQTGRQWHTVDPMTLSLSLLCRSTHCLGIFINDLNILKKIDRDLQQYPWYLGALQPETMCPIQSKIFLELLVCDAAISEGSVHLERSWEGEVDTCFDGAAQFKPNGCQIQPHGWLRQEGFSTPDNSQTYQTSDALDRLVTKLEKSPAQNVIASLVTKVGRESPEFSYRLDAVIDESSSLEAILPEGKFTKYLFVYKEKNDKSKWLTQELGIEPEDWRFLAAQLYSGLLRQSQFDVEMKEFQTCDGSGYRASFNQAIELTSRKRKKMSATAVWQLKPNELPSLVTLKTGTPEGKPLCAHYPVEVFPPNCLSISRHLEDLLRVADYEGQASADSSVPTPFLVDSVWQVEGLTGKVRLTVESDQLKEVIQKILGELSIVSSENGSFLFTASSNSLERAKAYGKSFGRVLGWNGFQLSVEGLPDKLVY